MDEPILKSGQWPNIAIDPRTGRHAATGEEIERGTKMNDNRTTELLDGLRNVGNLHEFAELFGFNWHDDSDWTWHDVAVKMADDLEQAIAATLGSEPPRTVYIVERYDSLTEGGYVEPTCYTSKQAAIRMVKSLTYDDGGGVQYWARCKELKVVDR